MKYVFVPVALLLAVSAASAQPDSDIVYQSSAIGGEDAITLHRPLTGGGDALEFRNLTLFPGRGLNLFQITANIPGRGETSLMLSPPLDEAAAKLTGEGDDRWGNLSHSFGGAFLVPYAGMIGGTVAPDGQTLVARWQGQSLTLPANWHGKLPATPRRALHGLILQSRLDTVEKHLLRDGEQLTGVLHAGDFGGHWPSSTDLAFTVTLTKSAVDITIRATNVGRQDEPMAIGWHPYFAIPSGMRAQSRLYLPATRVMEANDAIPTGRLLPVAGTPYDLREPEGRALGAADYNQNFSGLGRGPPRHGGAHQRSGGALWPDRRGAIAGNQDGAGLCPARPAFHRGRAAVQLSRSFQRRLERARHRHGDAEARPVHHMACAAGAIHARVIRAPASRRSVPGWRRYRPASRPEGVLRD